MISIGGVMRDPHHLRILCSINWGMTTVKRLQDAQGVSEAVGFAQGTVLFEQKNMLDKLLDVPKLKIAGSCTNKENNIQSIQSSKRANG